MIGRMCSCCGETYKDNERHDYEKCYKECEKRVEDARHHLTYALDHYKMAQSRRQAQRDGRIN